MIEQFAIWGRLKIGGVEGRHVLIAGEVDDYIVELTELVSAHATKSGLVFSNSTMKAKALRLLHHLERPGSFLKVSRHPHKSTSEWKPTIRFKSRAFDQSMRHWL